MTSTLSREGAQRRFVVVTGGRHPVGHLARGRLGAGLEDVGLAAPAATPPPTASGRAGRRRGCRWWRPVERAAKRFSHRVGRVRDRGRQRRAPGVEPVGKRRRPTSRGSRPPSARRWPRRRRRWPWSRRESPSASGRWNRGCRRPSSALVWTGTPITGTRVFEAIMPGRWAAPPAPGDDHRSPRPAAVLP